MFFLKSFSPAFCTMTSTTQNIWVFTINKTQCESEKRGKSYRRLQTLASLVPYLVKSVVVLLASFLIQSLSVVAVFTKTMKQTLVGTFTWVIELIPASWVSYLLLEIYRQIYVLMNIDET